MNRVLEHRLWEQRARSGLLLLEERAPRNLVWVWVWVANSPPLQELALALVPTQPLNLTQPLSLA